MFNNLLFISVFTVVYLYVIVVFCSHLSSFYRILNNFLNKKFQEHFLSSTMKNLGDVEVDVTEQLILQYEPEDEILCDLVDYHSAKSEKW